MCQRSSAIFRDTRKELIPAHQKRTDPRASAWTLPVLFQIRAEGANDENMRWRFGVGQWVYYRDGEETVKIEQKQLHYGSPYYRISTGHIVPEDTLTILSVDFNYY